MESLYRKRLKGHAAGASDQTWMMTDMHDRGCSPKSTTPSIVLRINCSCCRSCVPAPIISDSHLRVDGILVCPLFAQMTSSLMTACSYRKLENDTKQARTL